MRRCVVSYVFGLFVGIVGPVMASAGGHVKGTLPPVGQHPAHWGPRNVVPSPHPRFHSHPYHRHHVYPIWPVVAGSLIGSVVVEAIRPASPASTTVVVQRPVVQPVQVWIEGYWKEERDAYGRMIRRTWIPGHWEYR